MIIKHMVPISYNQLPGWGKDDLSDLKEKFLETLQKLSRNQGIELEGRAFTFGPLIDHLSKEPYLTRKCIEVYLQPYRIEGEEFGLFTGYFEPHLQASHDSKNEFTIPIYEKPNDLFYIPNLGKYNKHLVGERLAGRLESDTLHPYPTRGDIYKGALKDKAKILAWAKSSVDFFFLQVQGSGVLEFEDGTSQRIGYSATNGHVYKSIGKYLLNSGILSENDLTMEGVKSYLNALEPDELLETLAHNPSFIFFEKRSGNAPVGSYGIELLKGRSLAVDPKYVPLGTPLWLDCEHPDGGQIQKFMLAHDTGSAIKGPIRGDYFWGDGEDAGRLAGIMKSKGTYFLLLPKKTQEN